MSSYKVLFKGKDYDDKKLSFTFKGVSEKTINTKNSISELKKLCDKNPNITFFSNIEEILKYENSLSSRPNYVNYLIVLYTTIKDGTKEGILIGVTKDLESFVLGLWPFNTQHDAQISPEEITERFNNLVNNPRNYEICIID